MRRTWFAVRGWPAQISGWLVLGAAVGAGACALDERSPKQVVAPEQGSAGNAATNTNGGPLVTGMAGSGDGTSNGRTQTGAGGSGDDTPGSIPFIGSSGSPGQGGAAGGSDSTGQGGAAGSSDSPGQGGAGAGDDERPPIDPFGTDPVDATPPTTNTTSAACPAFEACGGSLDGNWGYSDVCIESAQSNIGLLQSFCPSATLIYERASGVTLTFANGSVARDGEPLGDSVITFPAACIQSPGCSVLQDAVGASGRCSDTSGDCVCRTAASVVWTMQSYSVTGARLALSDGRSFEYCVQGDTLTYRELGSAQEPGTYTLQRN